MDYEMDRWLDKLENLSMETLQTPSGLLLGCCDSELTISYASQYRVYVGHTLNWLEFCSYGMGS